jgi:hypothetical protein
MKALLGILGLAAVALALAHRLEPPQPAVLVDVPAPIVADPVDDLTLNEGNG